MQIRAAQERDLEQLAIIREQLWPGDLEEHRNDLRDFFSGNSILKSVFVAEADSSALVGFAELSIRNYAEGSKQSLVPFIEGWFVLGTYRRDGVGSLLVQACEMWAMVNGYDEIASNSLEGNELALKAHLATGFKVVERNISYLKSLK